VDSVKHFLLYHAGFLFVGLIAEKLIKPQSKQLFSSQRIKPISANKSELNRSIDTVYHAAIAFHFY
jgi:hypothetical protein